MFVWCEEYEEVLYDGVEFCFLNNLECFDVDGILILCVMLFGELDEKGCCCSVEINEIVILFVDSLIIVIGEQQDIEVLNVMGVLLDKNGWLDVDYNGEICLIDVFMIGDVQCGLFFIVVVVGIVCWVIDVIFSWENICFYQNDKYWNNVNLVEIY